MEPYTKFASFNILGSSDSLLFIPIVKEGENYVSSFITVRVTDSVTLNLYRETDYDFHPTGDIQQPKLSAERVALELMELNYLVFGHTVFEIKDTALFSQFYPDSANFTGRTMRLNQITYALSKVYWATTCYYSRAITSIPECYEWTFEIEEPYNWPPEDIPQLPGGGSGGGGGGENPSPEPDNCTGFEDCRYGTEIINGIIPCGDCGPGPVIVVFPEQYDDFFIDITNPVFHEDVPLIQNDIDVIDTIVPNNTGRIIGRTLPRNNTEDMLHGTSGDAGGILYLMPGFSDNELFSEMDNLFYWTTFFEHTKIIIQDLRHGGFCNT